MIDWGGKRKLNCHNKYTEEHTNEIIEVVGGGAWAVLI